MRYHFTPTETLTIKKMIIPSIDDGTEKLGSSCTAWGDVKWFSRFGKIWQFLKKGNPNLPYDSADPILGIVQLREMKIHKGLSWNVHSRIIHNRLKLETIQLSIKWINKYDKSIQEYISNIVEQTVDTCYNMEVPQKHVQKKGGKKSYIFISSVFSAFCHPVVVTTKWNNLTCSLESVEETCSFIFKREVESLVFKSFLYGTQKKILNTSVYILFVDLKVNSITWHVLFTPLGIPFHSDFTLDFFEDSCPAGLQPHHILAPPQRPFASQSQPRKQQPIQDKSHSSSLEWSWGRERRSPNTEHQENKKSKFKPAFQII